MTQVVAGLALVERDEADGRLRLALVDHANGFSRDACALTIDALELYTGTSGQRVRVDGIGNVATHETDRRRGLASALLEHAVGRMRDRGSAASLLYGIDGFYERFGWRSCGDERWVRVPLDGVVVGEPAAGNWHVRTMLHDDRPRVAACYERIAAATPGALARDVGDRVWPRLDPADVTVVERSGELVGWAWRGRDAVHERDELAARLPAAAAFAELQALDEEAMRVVLGAARDRARAASDEPGRTELVTGAPDGHPLRRLARGGQLECRLVDEVRPTGGPMLLPFTEAGEQLLGTELYQFVPDRF